MVKEFWYFTFGLGQTLLMNHYVKIEGPADQARAIMNANFGEKWSCQYTAKEIQPLIEEYGWKELKL